MATKPGFTVFAICGNWVKDRTEDRRLKTEYRMNEQDFFNEKQESKKATYSCPHCRAREEYDVRWLRRTKKQGPPRGANEQDRLRYQKSRDYMVRIDDMLACKSCRRRFDIPSSQSVVFI
jgi:uncharacterized protein YbaR (Trm112 family)